MTNEVDQLESLRSQIVDNLDALKNVPTAHNLIQFLGIFPGLSVSDPERQASIETSFRAESEEGMGETRTVYRARLWEKDGVSCVAKVSYGWNVRLSLEIYNDFPGIKRGTRTLSRIADIEVGFSHLTRPINLIEYTPEQVRTIQENQGRLLGANFGVGMDFNTVSIGVDPRGNVTGNRGFKALGNESFNIPRVFTFITNPDNFSDRPLTQEIVRRLESFLLPTDG